MWESDQKRNQNQNDWMPLIISFVLIICLAKGSRLGILISLEYSPHTSPESLLLVPRILPCSQPWLGWWSRCKNTQCHVTLQSHSHTLMTLIQASSWNNACSIVKIRHWWRSETQADIGERTCVVWTQFDFEFRYVIFVHVRTTERPSIVEVRETLGVAWHLAQCQWYNDSYTLLAHSYTDGCSCRLFWPDSGLCSMAHYRELLAWAILDDTLLRILRASGLP